ncbi:uncharacterized protein VP01_2904g3, partial [Puccinia sorghi]
MNKKRSKPDLDIFWDDEAFNLVSAVPDKVFNGEPVVFNYFLNNFRTSFFDHKCRHREKVALQNLRQTGTVLAYTQDFNQHACT